MDITKTALRIAKKYTGEREYPAGRDVWGDLETYKIELSLENDKATGWVLWQTSWPEYEHGMTIPTTWARLINLKCRAQLGLVDLPKDIVLKYCFEVMRAYDK